MLFALWIYFTNPLNTQAGAQGHAAVDVRRNCRHAVQPQVESRLKVRKTTRLFEMSCENPCIENAPSPAAGKLQRARVAVCIRHEKELAVRKRPGVRGETVSRRTGETIQGHHSRRFRKAIDIKFKIRNDRLAQGQDHPRARVGHALVDGTTVPPEPGGGLHHLGEVE